MFEVPIVVRAASNCPCLQLIASCYFHLHNKSTSFYTPIATTLPYHYGYASIQYTTPTLPLLPFTIPPTRSSLSPPHLLTSLLLYLYLDSHPIQSHSLCKVKVIKFKKVKSFGLRIYGHRFKDL